MKNGLFTFDQVTAAIKQDRKLIISADESFLSRLPKGSWIGGTSPYSMSPKGGAYLTDQAYVQELAPSAGKLRTKLYSTADIHQVYADGFANGFSVIMLPAFTDVLVKFALEVPQFPEFARKPLIGWVTGTKLEQLGQVAAKVYDGRNGSNATDKALVMHVELPANKYADLGVVNIFETSNTGDELNFDADNLEVKDVWVNGKKTNFATYMLENKVDLRWPLVGDYNGTTVNSSFMAIDEANGVVKLFAPVFKGVKYRLAKPAGDYQAYLEAFRKKTTGIPKGVALTCNCMFNYKYGDLDGKPLDELNGPFVFGEVAYQVFNQTLVYLTIQDK